MIIIIIIKGKKIRTRPIERDKGKGPMNAVIKELEDPARFYYKDLWLRETNTNIARLLELFSFGEMKDVGSIALTPLMREKLQKLTIISLSEKYRELPYDLIESQAQLDELLVEPYLMQLRHFFQAKLDPVRRVAVILHWHDCRDVYNGEKPLQLVNPTVTALTLRSSLVEWQSLLNK
ncbi:CSN9 (YDR179C) [Zygosaccharomyces parabailii]|nr:CSN9 (YDR179C) [Zygosaccharomyces parabailii]